jgi:micrococcal nuclease
MKKMAILILSFLLLNFLLPFANGSVGEIDETGIVTRVIDGDTFDIDSGERIRLADVDIPEITYRERGGYEATDYMIDLVEGKTVYLDIDDVYRTDYNGTGKRLVCVVYVDYNSTHYLNVNKALLVDNYAVVDNFYNEFNPYDWELYVQKDSIPEFPSFIVISFLMTTIFAGLVIFKKKLK